MPQSQSWVFEDGGEDENLKAQKKCCVYRYIHVRQSLGERFRGNRMLKCVFCGHEFQGNQFVAARHFRQGKGCPEVTDEALVDIHYNSEYKMSEKFLERIQRFEELHGAAPAVDTQRDEGGEGEMRDAGEQINVDDDEEEVARAGSSRRERGKGVVSKPGGQQGQYFASAHVSVRARAGADTPEASASAGKRKEREEGDRPTAAAAAQNRMRQKTITKSFTSKWQMEFKKKWLRFVYSQRLAFNVFWSEPWLDAVRHFRDLPGPVKVLCPSENEITDIETIVHTADDVGADLAEVRAPFYVTGATIISDGRKSRDARPIVNFLAGGSRGVMLVRMMNREGERDRAPDVLARWIKVFNDFPPKWVNAICTDSASAYVTAANMLQGPQQRPEHRRITWLPCAVHVCNKMLSDIGCSGPWSKDIIVRGRAVVRFIKEHGAALHIFRGESSQMGLIYPCETRLASVFAMVERLLAVRSALERTVDGDSWGMVPWDHSVRYLARWVRWQLRDFHTRRGTIAWGGRDGDRDAQRCRGDAETYESGCWWSRYGQCAPQLQVIALRVMYMWTCSSLAERNWAVHEGVQTKKRNRLEFEKVAELVEISANVRLLSHQRAGRGFALPWTLDESLLDVEGGIGIRPSWKGADESRTPEEVEDQRRSWLRDPYDSDSEGHEDEDEPAGPDSTTPTADERDEWSDPEDVRRRSGGDDLFIQVDLEEESGGHHGSPLERSRPTSTVSLPAERETDPGSAPSRGAESGIGHRPLGRSGTTSSTALPTLTEQLHRQPAVADRLQRLVRGPRQRLEDRLEDGPVSVQGDDRDRHGLVGGDGGALAGGGGGVEADAAVEGIPMGGGGGFSELTIWREAASAEVSSTGVDVQQGTHESGLAPTEEPRSEPAQHPAVERRREETLKEVAGVPLPAGSVKGAVHMSPGLEDIPTGQSVGVDDIRPLAQAEGIAPTTGEDGAVAATVGMSQTLVVRTAVGPVGPHQAPFLEGFRRPAHGGGPVEERRVGRGACIPPVPTFAPSRTRLEIRHVATPRGSLPFGFMTAEELEDHGRRDLTEIDQRVLRSVPGEGKLPHVQDLSWGPNSPSLPSGYSVAAPSGGAAGGSPSGGSVAAASGGVAGDLPSGGSFAAPSGGAAGPSSPLSAAPREGGSLTPRSVDRRRRDTTQRARELLDTMLFGRTDRPWSEMRRVTMASVGRQPGLIGVSTSVTRRDVVAAGFGGRGGGGGGSGGDGDDRREGAGSATTSAVDPPQTYGLREASIILEEPDVVTRLRQTRHVPLDRRQEGETSGTDGLPMAREARRRDDLAAAAIRTVRGRRVIMDDDPDELPCIVPTDIPCSWVIG
ncbi:hypothetical protein CBR_g38495 [Chara braunii]|uniref:DUF659 domain-containing protein n=1 Tax=Chara braunii TaxID=69332 RepID=A0A388JNW6_CHABU|nr:hypothetical protein CBR_g38495 [Chara braunii]|eukprot:GBG59471.1 hypothetical protein CBR_g38495 [Chara braunii]